MRKEKADIKELLQQFGDHIKQLRKEKGMKASELARVMETDKGTISRIERGELNPSLHFLCQLSEGFGISLQELLKNFNPPIE